jgi:hypothetical protein
MAILNNIPGMWRAFGGKFDGKLDEFFEILGVVGESLKSRSKNTPGKTDGRNGWLSIMVEIIRQQIGSGKLQKMLAFTIGN